MASLKKWTAAFSLLLIYFQVALADEVVSHVIMERIMEGMEEVLQKHNLKIESLENQMNKIVNKVGLLESKDQDILREIGKLERRIQATGAGESSAHPAEVTAKQPALQPTQENSGLKWNLFNETSHDLKTATMPSSKTSNITKEDENVFKSIQTNQPTLKSLVPTSSPTEFNKKIRLDHTDGRSYLLKNKNGKCLAVSTTGHKLVSENGAKIIQSNCNPLEKGQMWKWVGKHLCNDWGKCLSAPNKNFVAKSNVFQWNFNGTEKRQKWAGLKKMGLLINMDSCLSIVGNSDLSGEVITEACNEKESGQVWSFFWK